MLCEIDGKHGWWDWWGLMDWLDWWIDGIDGIDGNGIDGIDGNHGFMGSMIGPQTYWGCPSIMYTIQKELNLPHLSVEYSSYLSNVHISKQGFISFMSLSFLPGITGPSWLWPKLFEIDSKWKFNRPPPTPLPSRRFLKMELFREAFKDILPLKQWHNPELDLDGGVCSV